MFPSAHAAGWTSNSEVQTSNQKRIVAVAALVASATDKRKSRFVDMRRSLRQNMRNRHHFQNSARKLHVSYMEDLNNRQPKERRLAAFEKMNPKSAAWTKSFAA
jgi:hypothetical protein